MRELGSFVPDPRLGAVDHGSVRFHGVATLETYAGNDPAARHRRAGPIAARHSALHRLVIGALALADAPSPGTDSTASSIRAAARAPPRRWCDLHCGPYLWFEGVTASCMKYDMGDCCSAEAWL